MLKNSRSTLTMLNGNMAAGGGYSTDTQQTAPQLCYNAAVSSTTEQSSSIVLSTAQSFSDIQNSIHESIAVKGKFGMFSPSASASYLRSIEDKYYSLSLNYYAIYHNIANIQLDGFGLTALTDLGRVFYNNGNNSYFGLACGDQYFSAYKQGAMLIMSINVEFKSHYEKTQFEAKAGVSFGDIFSASGDVQRIASQYGISGSISMQAFQIGGDPSQLSKILNKNGNGDYYVLNCNLDAMNNCVSAASGMFDYAVNIFPTQFSFPSNSGLTPLGVGFATYQPIYYIGLTSPPSFVTTQVIYDRDFLAMKLDENQYYQQRTENLLNGYPVAWGVTSDLYRSLEKLHNTAQRNIEIIMRSSNPQEGGLGCYAFPDKCITITQDIIAKLVPITSNDLSVLKPLQYIMPADYVTFYFSGVTYEPISTSASSRDAFNNLYYVSLTDSSFNYGINFCEYNNCGQYKATRCFTTTSTDGIIYSGGCIDNTPQGGWSNCGSRNCGSASFKKVESPFWFEQYNNTLPSASPTPSASLSPSVSPTPEESSTVGAIVGGVIGGICGTVAVVGIGFLLYYKCCSHSDSETTFLIGEHH